MRYKARTKKGNHWVSGYYVRLEDGEKGRVSNRIYTGFAETEPDCDGYEFFPDWHEVDPSTLCRFTGKFDDCAVPIYEGDIVMVTKTYPPDPESGRRPDSKTEELTVFWDREVPAFRLKKKTSCGTRVDNFTFLDRNAEGVYAKVFGNVFDGERSGL